MEKFKKRERERKMYSNTDNFMLSNFLGVKAVCYEIGPSLTCSGYSASAAFRTQDN